MSRAGRDMRSRKMPWEGSSSLDRDKDAEEVMTRAAGRPLYFLCTGTASEEQGVQKTELWRSDEVVL